MTKIVQFTHHAIPCLPRPLSGSEILIDNRWQVKPVSQILILLSTAYNTRRSTLSGVIAIAIDCRFDLPAMNQYQFQFDASGICSLVRIFSIKTYPKFLINYMKRDRQNISFFLSRSA
jgi:hypothetical protein